MLLILSFVLIVINVSCATRAVDDFAKLKTGMEKSEVLEIVGDPTYKVRRKGQDRWTWVYYDQNLKQQSEVHFDEGKAVYVGAKPSPEVSADQQDAANELANLELEKKYRSDREAARDNLRNYEEANSPTGADSVAPTYEPVR